MPGRPAALPRRRVGFLRHLLYPPPRQGAQLAGSRLAFGESGQRLCGHGLVHLGQGAGHGGDLVVRQRRGAERLAGDAGHLDHRRAVGDVAAQGLRAQAPSMMMEHAQPIPLPVGFSAVPGPVLLHHPVPGERQDMGALRHDRHATGAGNQRVPAADLVTPAGVSSRRHRRRRCAGYSSVVLASVARTALTSLISDRAAARSVTGAAVDVQGDLHHGRPAAGRGPPAGGCRGRGPGWRCRRWRSRGWWSRRARRAGCRGRRGSGPAGPRSRWPSGAGGGRRGGRPGPR